MAKGKVEKTSGGDWGELGGNNKMFGFAGTSTQEPGQSAQEGRSGGKRGIEPKAGSSNVAYVSSGAHNTDYAGTATPGGSGPTKHGGDAKFAEGGKTHMWGKGSARRAIGGQTAQDTN